MPERIAINEEEIVGILSEVIDELTGDDPEGLYAFSETLPELILNLKFSKEPIEIEKIKNKLFFVIKRLYDLNAILDVELKYRQRKARRNLVYKK